MLEIEGYLTVPEAAHDLGLSRQRGYQLVHAGKFRSATKVGRKPVILIRDQEVKTILYYRDHLDKLPADAGTEWDVWGKVRLREGVVGDSGD